MTQPIESPVAPNASRRRGSSRAAAEVQAWIIVAAMVVLLVICYLVTPWRDESLRPSAWWVVIVLAAAQALSEYQVFDIEVGDEAHTFSLSDIPTALAVVFLTPVGAIASRLIGATPVLIGPRRNRGLKLVFNIVLCAVEMTIAVLLTRLLVDAFDDSDAVLLVSLMVGLIVSSFVAGALVATIISRFEANLWQRLRAEVGAYWWFHSVNGILGAMAVGLVMHEPWLALALIPPVVGIWFVLRRFGLLAQEMDDLNAVHGFVGRVGSTLDVDDISTRAVGDLVELLHADGAALLRLVDGNVVSVRSGHVPIRAPATEDDPTWRFLVADGDARLVDAARLRALGAVTDSGLQHVMTAPIVEDGRTFAVLVVTERNMQRFRFNDGDLRRLRNMADQLAVGLRRGLLHEQLEYEARHDALTDLPGRTLFEWAVRAALDDRTGRVAAVMMLDLDRFKEVNDTLGHHAGDELLVEFSRRISEVLEADDMLARLAGDEFALLCYRDDVEQLAAVARGCVELGGRPVVLDGLEIVVTVSVGLAVIDADEDDPMQPIRRADIAMYNAKWQRTGVELYRDEIDRRTPARLSMLGDLRAAIEGDEIDVVFQPKLELGSGRVVGAEALVRWDSPSRGRVSPTEFVRVAEDTGLIKDLTDLVLKRGVAALRMFDDAGLGLRLAINLSTHDLFDTKLPARVLTQLEYNQVHPSELTLEITESSLLVDAPRTRATIDDLHEAGFRLAVDDFGTGYSSLSYLRRLPVQELKIDQSFVSNMLRDPQDEVIVRSTIDLGHNLRLSVVAEGVEDDATLHALASMGCDVAQGYWIARPLSAPELIAWVDERRRQLAAGQERPSVSRPG